METVELSELYKLFNKDYIDCNVSDGIIRMNVEESDVNIITFSIYNLNPKILQDIVNRVVKILRDRNTLSIKRENRNDRTIYFSIFCKSDPILKQVRYIFNIIKEYQTDNILLERIAFLSTIKNFNKPLGNYVNLSSPTTTNDYQKQYIISTIDETKPIDKDIDIINLFKSEFDFDMNYDHRDIGHLLSYLSCNKHVYEQPIISREEAYDSYVDFCNRNYLNHTFTKHMFGKKIKMFCNIKQKLILDKRIKRYYLSKFGKSCIEDPEIYYTLLKEEERNKESEYMAYSESFDKYFKENKDSYKDYTFTKFEAYDDYENFCKINSYEPIVRNNFYRLMLKECVVKRPKEKNGSECFIIEQYSYTRVRVPDEHFRKAKAEIEKQIDIVKTQTDMIEGVIRDFMNRYHDDFTSYTYTRPEAFDLYEKYCITNNQEPIGKLIFYKQMQKYCDECRHRPSPSENPKIYFICRSNFVAPDSSN